MKVFALALLVACGATPPPPPPPAPADNFGVEIAGDRITRITPANVTLWPSIVDSHVHLAYWPVGDQLAKTGIGAVVDLAAPSINTSSSLHVISSGPMLTKPDGYPLESWGRDGYGIGCSYALCVEAEIQKIVKQGARVIKIALDDSGLDPSLLAIAVKAAHAENMKVAVHALSDRSALLAAQAGADILAHTPVEPLRAETIAAWKGRAVISTLAAFGGTDAAIANLRALREAGVTVLYGTDLGNLRDAGPSAAEVALLSRAGLDNAAIVDAMTTTPARFWNLPFGAISVGGEATFLVLDRDPRTDVRTLLSPRAVYLRGKRM